MQEYLRLFVFESCLPFQGVAEWAGEFRCDMNSWDPEYASCQAVEEEVQEGEEEEEMQEEEESEAVQVAVAVGAQEEDAIGTIQPLVANAHPLPTDSSIKQEPGR